MRRLPFALILLASCCYGQTMIDTGNHRKLFPPPVAVATPTQTPDTGTYANTQSVTIATSTGGATIIYCTNASADCSPVGGTTYSTAVSVASSEHLCSYATHAGMTDSAVKCSTYAFQVAAPTQSPDTGSYTGTQSVTIATTTSGAALHYCTDPADCSSGWSTYSSPVSVASSEHLCSYGTLAGYTDSAIKCSTYTISVGLTIRGSASLVASANSYQLNFPAGTAAGDFAVGFCGLAYSCNLPSGWTSLDNSAGGGWSGEVISKTLTSGDISTGHVTITATGTYDGTVALVVFVGATGGVRETVAQRITTPLNTSSSVASGDLLLYYGSNRSSGGETISRGTTIQSPASTANASMLLNSELLTSGGSSIFVTFTGGGNSYQAIVVVKP